jgi:F1F0 ATPase subunit 2
MMMIDLIQMISSCSAGLLLGAIFFGGLWLTVQYVVHAKYPAAWMMASTVLRMLVVLAGFWAVGIAWSPEGQVARLVCCVAGFLIARLFVTFRIKRGLVADRTAPMEHQP